MNLLELKVYTESDREGFLDVVTSILKHLIDDKFLLRATLESEIKGTIYNEFIYVKQIDIYS